MDNKCDGDIRLAEVVRVLLFILVLFSGAEIIAPFFKISFSDPLFLATFVTGALGTIIGYTKSREAGARSIMIIKANAYDEFCEKISGSTVNVKRITFIDNADDAVKLIKGDKNR